MFRVSVISICIRIKYEPPRFCWLITIMWRLQGWNELWMCLVTISLPLMTHMFLMCWATCCESQRELLILRVQRIYTCGMYGVISVYLTREGLLITDCAQLQTASGRNIRSLLLWSPSAAGDSWDLKQPGSACRGCRWFYPDPSIWAKNVCSQYADYNSATLDSSVMIILSLVQLSCTEISTCIFYPREVWLIRESHLKQHTAGQITKKKKHYMEKMRSFHTIKTQNRSGIFRPCKDPYDCHWGSHRVVTLASMCIATAAVFFLMVDSELPGAADNENHLLFYGTLALAEISWTPLLAASLMMGVMRPLSVATAIAIWIESRGRGPLSDQVTFTSGISWFQIVANKEEKVPHSSHKETQTTESFKNFEKMIKTDRELHLL